MFELNGNPVTLEQLQNAAVKYNMDFDEYLEKMKAKGLVEKQPDSPDIETPTVSQDDTGSESGDGSSALLDRIKAGDYDYEVGEAPVEEVKPSKYDNYFTDIIPAALDNAAVRIIDPSKFQIGPESVKNFKSEENFEALQEQYPGVVFDKVGLGGGTVTVKLPNQKSPRPFKIPSDDQGLSRLRFQIADYIDSKQETFFKEDSNVESEIDRIWNEHSLKWNAEDLMSDELQTLLGSDYVIETSGTLGNEFTVTKDEGKGASIDIRVGRNITKGWDYSDTLKRFLTQGQKRFEDTPEYKKDVKEVTEIANRNYINNPTELNEIFQRNGIKNPSDLAKIMTPKNKEKLVQHILSDMNAKGGWFNAARTNFDNLTNMDINDIVNDVVTSHVDVEVDRINEKRSNKELQDLKDKGFTDIQIEDLYNKRHSATFSVMENDIKNKIIEIDRGMHLPGQLETKNKELEDLIKIYREQGGANYDILMDINTGKLAASVTDPKNENIINLKDLVQEQMANYEGLTRDELKIEFLKTATALSEFDDETKDLRSTSFHHGASYRKYAKQGVIGVQIDEFDVLTQQKADLLSKMEGLKRMYLLNERLETVDKSDLGGFVQQVGRSFIHSFGEDPSTVIVNNGVTEAQTVAAMKDIYSDMNIPLSAAARKHSKTNTADMIAEGLGGLPVVVAEFYAAGQILNGVKYITGINKWVQTLGKSRYKQGTKLLDESKVIKKANKWAKSNNMNAIEGKGLNLSTTDLSTIGAFIASPANIKKGKQVIDIVGPSTINKAKMKAVAALTEGTAFSMVERDIEGMPKGIAFNLAGGVIPGFKQLAPSVQKRLTSVNVKGLAPLKTLYDANAMGVRMMVGNKAGEAFNALIKDAMGAQEWQTFLKDNYDDPDMVMSGLITDYVLGSALAGTHAKIFGPGGFDRMTYNKIKSEKGKFLDKRNEYTNVDAEGNRSIKKGSEKSFHKWNDLHTEAQRRLWEYDGLGDYLNPLLAPSLAKKEVKKIENNPENMEVLKQNGFNGIEVKFKAEGETGRLGGFVENKKTGKIEIELDPYNLSPGLVSHEIHHPLFKLAMKNKATKAATIKKLLEITKDIKLTEKTTLYDAIKNKGITSLEDMDLAKVQEAELMAYISQTLRDGAKLEGINKSNGWGRLKKWIDSSLGKQPSKGELRAEAQTRTKNDIINWFGDYHKNIGEGGPSLSHFKKLTELVDKWTPYGKEMETTKPGEIGMKTIGSTKGDYISLSEYSKVPKQKGLSSQVLVDAKGVPINVKTTKKEDQDFNNLLQNLAIKPLDPRDAARLEKMKEITIKRDNYKSDKDFNEAKQQLENDILNLETPSNAYEVVNMYDPAVSSNAGTGRVINTMNRRFNTASWPFMQDIVKDFLTSNRGIKGLTADYARKVREGDINPKTFSLGDFIGGKFDVRFQESVDKIGKKEFEISKDAEGMKETEYKDTWMEDFETQDLSIKQRLERENWLEEKGLTEETAESYIAEQNLITLSKDLGLRNADVVVGKAQATIPELKRNLEPQRSGESKKDYNKRIVSHKNSIKQYRESIEKDLLVDFWGISESTANKMSVVGKEGQSLKTAMAWQIKGTENKPGDLQAVKKVVEANVPTILTAISKGAQNKIDPIYLTEVAPDIVKGKSAGVPKVLLHNKLLFTPTSKRQQTDAGLQPFIQSEGFIKYQKTKDQTYKTEFEQKFAESLKSPQDYKAVMQEVGKNVYLQSVRSALPAESALARQLEAGKNEGLASERLLNNQIIKDNGTFKASLSGVRKLFKTPEYKKFDKKDKDNFLDKYAEKLDGIKGKSEAQVLAEITSKPKAEMEAVQAKNHKDMVEKLIKEFELFKGIKQETMDGFSEISTEKAIQDMFEAALGNQYPVGAESIIIKNAGNGKNNNWNFKTKQYERIKHDPNKPQTIQNWFDYNLGREVFTGNGKKITDAEYSFFRESVTKDTGDFKTKIANEVVAAKNAGKTNNEIKEIVWKTGRELVAGKTKDINKVIEANIKKRQFHMDAIKHVIENHADYGLTRQEAVQAALRHVRRHTNITDGSIKGTATITAGSMEVGIPVGKDALAKNFLGSMYHAEHQMQLQNHTYTFFNSLGRNWNKKTKSFNNKRYKDEMDILSKLFEQSTTVKQDQLIYDSPLFGGNTTYLKAFAGKNLGEVSSILNILYQKGVSGSIVDFKSKTPKTIKESIIDNYNQKQLDILLKESIKIGEANSLHHELSSINKGRKAVETQNLKTAKKAGLPIAKNAKPSEVLASMRIGDKSLDLGRKKKKESRGMSTWDFDDTLATTKSGVRATIPNPSGKPKPNRKVIFLAGGAGSGKGNVIKKLNLEGQGFKIVNSDISLEWLKKNNGLPENMNDLTKEQRSMLGSLQHQARGIAKRKMMKYKGNADGVVVDGTGGSIKAMEKLVNEFKDKGYDVSMLFVETSLPTALARNKARAERSLLDKIVERNHEAVQGNKSGFKTMFGERFMEVKTDKLKQEDAMPIELVNKMNDFVSSYEKVRLDAEQFATEGKDILDRGGKFDFAEFNVVTGGEKGPFFQKALERAKKFGTKDQFVLTARPAEAARPIYEFLKSQGLEIPIENITGLGNSTGEAKAMWMLKKFSEGYNDMYFADDAMQNVKAVRDVLNQLDVKSKVQQALASKKLDVDINNIMESTFGIESKKRFSTAEGKMRGRDKKRRKFFIPDSAADLELLMEPIYGKGKKGIENKKWFGENFYKPWERGINDLHTARQTILNDYMSLRKQSKDIVKSLDKPAGETNFTNDMAARVYIWNKAGFEIPGLTKTSKAKLLEHVANNPKLQAYAENVAVLTKIETGLKKPKETWWAETLATEVSETGKTVGREKYIGDWLEKRKEIFSEENLAKMESELGPKWRDAIDNMLYRMETGTTKPKNLGRIGNGIMNYLNGSVGAIMNLNTRSATLQLISTVNFINHAENNPLRAAQAFANQPQYWKDFMKIMNSDMLKQRRNGLQINVTEAELAAAVDGKGSKAKRALAYILKQGYIPTKIADSFAISTGGATYYRNRIRMYEKQGLKTKEAEKKAWLDFQEIAEKTQQSSRPDLLSQSQVSFEGRLLLPFANTPMQMNRIMMKEMLDLSKGRYEGAFGENSFTNKASKIAYYGFIQSAIFAGLQTGAFALMANSDDEEQIAQKKVRAYNTIADSFLRGMGIPGVVASGVKNAGMKFYEQNQKGFAADYSEVGEALLNMSPTIGSKFSKLDAAGGTYQFNKKEILEKGLSLDNTHGMEAAATTVEALTNVPIARVIRKTENIQGALDQRNEAWQRFLMGLGWSDWDIGGIEYQEKKAEKEKEKKPKIFQW
jgi:predicted kinase